MVDPALGESRLVAQGLVTRPWASPARAVAAHGAMQGQDLPGVLASVALRTTGGLGAVIDDLDAGRVVRGYPMRGTVFLQAAEDVAWTSQLCTAGPMRAAQKRRAQLELSDAMVEAASEKSQQVLAHEPGGLSRAELFAYWAEVGTPTDKGRGYHVLAHLIGRGELVYGPWNGTDQNIVSSSVWLPKGMTLQARFNGDTVAAVAEFLCRYLTSHGPATLRDFSWWTKLPLRDIKPAFGLVADRFEGEDGAADDDVDALRWRVGLMDEVAGAGSRVDEPLLLPGFDEFILGYADRLFAMTPEQHVLLLPGSNGVLGRTAVSGGIVRGLWKRGGRPGRRSFELHEFDALSARRRARFEKLFDQFPFTTP